MFKEQRRQKEIEEQKKKLAEQERFRKEEEEQKARVKREREERDLERALQMQRMEEEQSIWKRVNDGVEARMAGRGVRAASGTKATSSINKP